MSSASVYITAAGRYNYLTGGLINWGTIYFTPTGPITIDTGGGIVNYNIFNATASYNLTFYQGNNNPTINNIGGTMIIDTPQ